MPLLALGLVVLRPTGLGAQQPCVSPPVVSPTSEPWSPPLDHPISLSARGISRRDALDRVAALGGFRLSYSSDLLALDQAICVVAHDLPAGQVLLELLAGTGTRPVAAAPDHVVLAPSQAPAADSAELPELAVPLETIVVTGTVAGASLRPLPLALEIVDGEDLRALDATTVSSALSGSVPGIWVWTQSPGNLLTSYASIRGASSFGLSYPKVYIDGIEVANPLVVTGLQPETIDRIEVIRGPQGAALYGADAISGVMNIVTRTDGADPELPRVSLQSKVGLVTSDFSSDPTVEQRHSLGLRFGSNLRSASLHISAGGDGGFIPGASSTNFSAQGGMRMVGSRTLWTGLLRFAWDHASAPASPLLPDSLVRPAFLDGHSQTVVGYTLGSTLKLIPSDRWTHTLMLGLDGYTLDGVTDDRTPIPSAADSALRAAEGGAVRGTVRLGTLRRFGFPGGTGDVGITAEHSTLHQWAGSDSLAIADAPAWRNTTGGNLLGNLELGRQVYLSAGARVEHTTDNDPRAVPMIGGSLVESVGDLTLKVRGSYGRGIRWPSTLARRTLFGNSDRLVASSLEPEEQSGVEVGLDLLVGGWLTAGVTRFDQTASGLIQGVAVVVDSSPGPGGPRPRVGYQYQNVGEIGNQGWELSGGINHRGFSLTGAFTTVDSRVNKVAPRYRGDLQAGDRMLEVPARTMGVTARWRDSNWSVAAGLTRAEDWINYDRLALAEAYSRGNQGRGLTGAELRNFWKEYPGVTRLRASLSRMLDRRVRLTVSGENLLDEQTGEPDNITVLPGRTFSLSLWAGF